MNKFTRYYIIKIIHIKKNKNFSPSKINIFQKIRKINTLIFKILILDGSS